MYGYRERRETFLEEFDGHFLFQLVNVCYPSFQASEGAADYFHGVSSSKVFDNWFGYYESLECFRRDDAFGSRPCVANTRNQIVYVVWSSGFDKDVPFHNVRG